MEVMKTDVIYWFRLIFYLLYDAIICLLKIGLLMRICSSQERIKEPPYVAMQRIMIELWLYIYSLYKSNTELHI